MAKTAFNKVKQALKLFLGFMAGQMGVGLNSNSVQYLSRVH